MCLSGTRKIALTIEPACPAQPMMGILPAMPPPSWNVKSSSRGPRKRARRWSPDCGMHFVTFSCYRRQQLLGEPHIRSEFVEHLAAAKLKHRFKLLAWVVMPEHVHLMVMPTTLLAEQGSLLPSILMAIKRPLSSAALERWRALPFNSISAVTSSVGTQHCWQPGGGFDRNVRDIGELAREVRYIHQNPVTRGLVAAATEWPWSSARWYAGWKNAWPEIDQVVFDRHAFPGKWPEVLLG